MFDAAPVSDPKPLQQSAAYARALDEFGRPPLRLADGTLALKRRFGRVPVTMLTRPLAETPGDIAALARAIPSKGLRILSPDRPMPLHHISAVPLVSPNWVASLDLTPDQDQLMAGLHQKWRNRLRHAEAQGLRITRQNLPDDPNNWMLQADLSQQSARGYRSWPLALTLAYGRANRGNAKLFTAFIGRAPVAAILILRHGTTATYHVGHTRPSGRLASAHTLLMWRAALWAKSKGLQIFDLGTIDTEDGRGLARFKLGMGATARPLGGTWLWWPPLTRAFRPVARFDRALMQLS